MFAAGWQALVARADVSIAEIARRSHEDDVKNATRKTTRRFRTVAWIDTLEAAQTGPTEDDARGSLAPGGRSRENSGMARCSSLLGFTV